MTELPQTSLSSSSTFVNPSIKYVSRWSIFLHLDDMAKPAEPLDVNALHMHVIEKLIQLIVASDTEIIVNSHLSEDLT